MRRGLGKQVPPLGLVWGLGVRVGVGVGVGVRAGVRAGVGVRARVRAGVRAGVRIGGQGWVRVRVGVKVRSGRAPRSASLASCTLCASEGLAPLKGEVRVRVRFKGLGLG